MTPDAVLEWIKVLVPPFAAFGLGYWSSRSLEGWKIKRMQPIIEIQDDVLPIELDIEIEKGNPIPFIANRLILINKGRSGAKDCKVYIRVEDTEEIRSLYQRTGWMLPDDNTALTVTLNVNVPEYVDLCAISKDARHIAFTNERGFKGKPLIQTLYPLKYVKVKDFEATVIVASSNAQPAERRIIFHIITPDENNKGIIVKFPEENPQPQAQGLENI